MINVKGHIGWLLPVAALICFLCLPFHPAGSRYEEGVVEEIRRYSRINSDADLLSALHESCDIVRQHIGTIECVQMHKGSDGSEAIVLVAPQFDNHCGTALLLSLMSSFYRTKKTYWHDNLLFNLGAKHWSRDLIFLFPDDKRTLDSWLADYHSVNSSRQTGAIQTAMVIKISGRLCLSYHSHELFIEGEDGLLPNLDLVNTMVKMGSFKRLIINVNGKPRLPKILKPLTSQYEQLIKMIWRQGSAALLEPHSSFLKYRIDAVTLKAESKRGIDSSMRSTFEAVEGTTRSMNNLLEHMHQSFFFYLLPKRDRFVSIANYLAIPALQSCAFLYHAYRSKFGNQSNSQGKPMWNQKMTIMAIIASLVTRFFMPSGAYLSMIIDTVHRFTVHGDPESQMMGGVMYAMGLLLLSLSNVSLAILMGSSAVITAFPMPSITRKVLFLLMSPMNLLLLNDQSWNFGIPYILLYPANVLLSI